MELFDDVWLRAHGLALFADFIAHGTQRTPVEVDKRHEPLLVAFGEGPDANFVAMRDHIRAGLSVHRTDRI